MTIITKDSELKVLDYLKNIENSYESYYALYFNLSKLLDRNRSEFQIKIGLNVISDFFRKNRGSVFLLKNYDLIVMLEDGTKDLVEKIIYQLRYLFIDDPLAFKKQNVENPDFSNVYVLAFQWNEFFKFCRQKLEIDQSNFYQEEEYRPTKTNSSSVDRLVTSYNFSKIESDLIDVDLTHLVRRQSISVLIKDKNIKPIFSEIYVSPAHLKDYLKYDSGFLDNKILFRYFMERIDNKVLDLIKSDIGRYLYGASNLNLNIETILSEDFLEFHKILKAFSNASLVIDIDIADVFLDLGSFYYANQFLKELGYKTCLDGIDNYSFTHIDRKSLDFDLIKLSWDPDTENDVSHFSMKEAIQKCNPNRVILTNCSDQESLKYGHDLGLFLFQGWWLEKMQNKEAEISA